MSWSRTKLYCLVVRVYNIVTMVFNASHHGLNDKRSEKSLSTCCCYCPGNKQCTQFSCFLTRLATIIKLAKYVHAPMTAFPSFEKNFLQIRKQKDSNLITHSLVTVTVTLRVASIWVRCKHSGHCLYFNYFSHGPLNFPPPPSAAPECRDGASSGPKFAGCFNFWLEVTEKGWSWWIDYRPGHETSQGKQLIIFYAQEMYPNKNSFFKYWKL